MKKDHKENPAENQKFNLNTIKQTEHFKEKFDKTHGQVFPSEPKLDDNEPIKKDAPIHNTNL